MHGQRPSLLAHRLVIVHDGRGSAMGKRHFYSESEGVSRSKRTRK